VTFAPATIGPECVFVSDTFALVVTGVGPSVALLLPGVGSAVAEVTVAVLLTVPVRFAARATSRSTLVVVPLAINPCVHVTVKDPVQIQPGEAVETNITPAGSTSVTVASAAADGPKFETEIVYVAVVPATSVPACTFVTNKSALVFTTDGPSVATLFAGVGSGVVDDAVALLVKVPVTPAAMATRRSRLDEAPLTIPPRVHVTVVAPLHVHPTDEVEMNVTPAGNASTTVASAESDGPLFVTITVNVALVPATSDPP
jgi:hypothetical protein